MAISRRYLLAVGSQMPDRSGLPSRVRGAGAERFGFPSAVRGIAPAGTLVHCAISGRDIRDKPHSDAAAWNELFRVINMALGPRSYRRLYTRAALPKRH